MTPWRSVGRLNLVRNERWDAAATPWRYRRLVDVARDQRWDVAATPWRYRGRLDVVRDQRWDAAVTPWRYRRPVDVVRDERWDAAVTPWRYRGRLDLLRNERWDAAATPWRYRGPLNLVPNERWDAAATPWRYRGPLNLAPNARWDAAVTPWRYRGAQRVVGDQRWDIAVTPWRYRGGQRVVPNERWDATVTPWRYRGRQHVIRDERWDVSRDVGWRAAVWRERRPEGLVSGALDLVRDLRRWLEELPDRTVLVGGPIAVWLVVVLIWQTATTLGGVDPYVVPRPTEIVAELFANADAVVPAALSTARNALLGLLVGVTVALLGAALTTASHLIDDLSSPVVTAAAAIPVVSLAPVAYAMYGTDSEVARVAVAAVAVLVPVYLNTLRGLRTVEPVHRDLLRSYAATPWQATRTVLLPGALPFFFVGLRVAAPLAVVSALVAECFGGPATGLGTAITSAAASSHHGLAWAYVLGAMVVGLAFHLLVDQLEKLPETRLLFRAAFAEQPAAREADSVLDLPFVTARPQAAAAPDSAAAA